MLRKLSDLVDQNKHMFATIETWDNGKPYSDAMVDVEEVRGLHSCHRETR